MKRIISVLCIAVFGICALCAQSVDRAYFNGTWAATVEYNNSFDDYFISFLDNGSCTVRVINNNAEQETTGNWSWDGTYLRLNATFRNARIAYLSNIQWTSIVSLSGGNNSFNILGRAAVNGPQTRITFFRNDNAISVTYDDKAIPSIFNSLSATIPPGSRLAVVGITSADAGEASFYLNELVRQFVNTRRYTVVERSDIDAVINEQNFQMTGLVGDDDYISIGKFIGAEVVITGSISGSGAQKRLTLKAIDMLTSAILSMVSVGL